MIKNGDLFIICNSGFSHILHGGFVCCMFLVRASTSTELLRLIANIFSYITRICIIIQKCCINNISQCPLCTTLLTFHETILSKKALNLLNSVSRVKNVTISESFSLHRFDILKKTHLIYFILKKHIVWSSFCKNTAF